jgi:para-nitrobenzyl esterase
MDHFEIDATSARATAACFIHADAYRRSSFATAFVAVNEIRSMSLSKIFKVIRLVGALALLAVPLQARGADDLRVQTKDGVVEGFLKDGVVQFLGIPYAAPPIGELRWKPPQTHTPWTGVLKASVYGPTCAQITTLGVFAGPPTANEDCLYLNVFTPSAKSAGRKKLPVIVWIHGGANVDGESNDYDGSKLASQGQTVVVTINYRLGLFGFLAHPSLDSEGHLFANYGILDQQAALQWVKQNIEEFGGDAKNVTVGGQSAGSVDTNANVISPLAAGLFERAIFQSVLIEPAPLAVADAKGTAFAVAAGCGSGAGPDVAKCLRDLSAEQVLKLSGTGAAFGAYTSFLIQDGKIIPMSYVAAYESGKFNHMPIMIGTTQDEGNFFIAIHEYFSGPPRVAPTEADFKRFVTNTYSETMFSAGSVERILARYVLSDYATPQLALDAVQTDAYSCRSRNAAQLLSKRVPIYAYEFNDRTAPLYFPEMPGFQALAYHTSDIQYLFPHYHGGPEGIPHELNEQQKHLSDQLVAAWTNFARTGNPNGEGNVPWPIYQSQPDKASYLSQNIPALSTFTDSQFSAAHKCDLWDAIIDYAGAGAERNHVGPHQP